MNKIIIRDGKLILDGKFSLEEFMTITATHQLSVMKSTVEAAPEKHQQQLRQHVFDQVNELYSTVLAQFAPDIDLRPDLTAETLLELENQHLDKHNKKAKVTELHG